MKIKFILAVAITILSIPAIAQKGSKYIGGQLGFFSNQSKRMDPSVSLSTSKSTSWSVSPEVGTFLTDRVALGLGLIYQGGKSREIGGAYNVQSSRSLGGKAYLRHFWGKDAFKPFVGFNVEYLGDRNKNETRQFVQINTGKTFRSYLNAGFGYALSKRVTALGSFGFLGYFTSTTQVRGSDVKYRLNSFGFDANSLGDRFNIGFYYTFKN